MWTSAACFYRNLQHLFVWHRKQLFTSVADICGSLLVSGKLQSKDKSVEIFCFLSWNRTADSLQWFGFHWKSEGIYWEKVDFTDTSLRVLLMVSLSKVRHCDRFATACLPNSKHKRWTCKVQRWRSESSTLLSDQDLPGFSAVRMTVRRGVKGPSASDASKFRIRAPQ